MGIALVLVDHSGRSGGPATAFFLSQEYSSKAFGSPQ